MRPCRSASAYTLAEMLVYMGVLSIVMGVAWLSYYRVMGDSMALARNTEDIVRTLKAGERWREDIRSATAPPRLADGVLHIPQGAAEVLYRLSGNAVERRIAGNPPADEAARWLPALTRLKASRMQADAGKLVASWRWEVELESRRAARIRPRFTFMAVPTAETKR